MEMLKKKENWWIWLLIFLFGGGIYPLILGSELDIYNKDAWYNKVSYWAIGALLLFIPFSIMIVVLAIQAQVLSSKKLGVKGANIYELPYIWILMIIIPIIGWLAFIILYMYLSIASLIEINNGKLEKLNK